MNTGFIQFNWLMPLLAITGLLVMRAQIFITFPLLWTQNSKWAAQRQIIKSGPVGVKRYFKDMGSIIFLHFFDAVITIILLKTGLLNTKKNDSPLEFVTVFAFAFVWIEIYFYYSHRLLHHPKLFWIHRTHHHGAPLNPLTSLSFSFIERFILLFGSLVIPAVISLWIPISAEALMTYFYVNYFLNVVGHMNVEIYGPAFVSSWAGRVFYTPTFHALHHLRYTGHFGLFTSFLDKLHGTYFEDYPEFHEDIITRAKPPNSSL